MNSAPAVSVRELTVRFGDFTAVDRVSFEVPKGEIFGFLGANGAGKTTTIRVLCGLLIPSSGEAFISGSPVNARNEALVKSKVGYMSQKFTLYDDLTVDENLDFAANLRKIPAERFRKRKAELFEFIEFRRGGNALVRDLPGGIKQQISLVAALLHDPEIVFLDEPTAGVTPAARARFWNLIRSLAAGGHTVFVTTHYMDEAEQCGRIALMRNGGILALDTPDGLKRTAFPEPLIEITPGHQAPGDAARFQGLCPEILSVQPHGMRYHAILRTGSQPARVIESLQREAAVTARPIPPSLEDVFIRLVEGGTPPGGGRT